jgi:heparanase 1
VIALKKLVDDIYRSNQTKPLVLAPGGFFDQAWFSQLIVKTKPNLLNVITHHIYNLGPGILTASYSWVILLIHRETEKQCAELNIAGKDTHLIDKIFNPSILDGMKGTFSSLQGMLKSAGTSTVAWVGEAGGAYNSGRHLVTDAFVFSFW